MLYKIKAAPKGLGGKRTVRMKNLEVKLARMLLSAGPTPPMGSKFSVIYADLAPIDILTCPFCHTRTNLDALFS